MTACPIANQFPGHGCMDIIATERRFDSQATWVIDMLGLFLVILSIGVCTTRYWQTSGQLVQEVNICTVGGFYNERFALFSCSITIVNL